MHIILPYSTKEPVKKNVKCKQNGPFNIQDILHVQMQ